MIEKDKIVSVIQYALAIASLNDERQEQSLSPLHLIKYVYLVDFEYAKKSGVGYTGVEWKFHHFGPWSYNVYEMIEPAVKAIGAYETRLSSNFDKDSIRYKFNKNYDIDWIEKKLNYQLQQIIKKYIRKYSNDTSSLLHNVYMTEPMLNAAPGEILNLHNLTKKTELDKSSKSSLEKMDSSKIDRINSFLKEIIKKKFLENKINTKYCDQNVHNPMYDEIYFKGIEWLDSLAGEPITEIKSRASFASDIWKINTRSDTDV